MRPTFDLQLFQQLNEEYDSRRIVPAPRQFTPEARRAEADRRTARIDRRLDVAGKRILEIGCGTGSVGRELVERYDCEVVGIDIDHYTAWETNQSDRLTLVQGDISEPPHGLGQFDAMFSFSVWEHLVHPYAALAACYKRLKPGGQMFLQAQLHRGPKASHRYREVFFPWPHLLFTPDVFEKYYASIGDEPKRPAWVNHLTFSQYVDAFDRVGFDVKSRRASGPDVFDREFYERFEEVLSAYPEWDLRHDVITTVLERPRRVAAATNIEPSVDAPPGEHKETLTNRAERGAKVIWRRVPRSVRHQPALQWIARRIRRP